MSIARARGSADGERVRNCELAALALEFAPMGWAIGAAVGVARANPHWSRRLHHR